MQQALGCYNGDAQTDLKSIGVPLTKVGRCAEVLVGPLLDENSWIPA